MWKRVLHWFSSPSEADPVAVHELRLVELVVEPEPGEDFQSEACQRLLGALAAGGAETVGAVGDHQVCVSLEDFFQGNNGRHSIAANACTDVPYESLNAWFDLLREAREQPWIHEVWVQVAMVEPHEDGRLGMWPYADTLWVCLSGASTQLESWLAPLAPDEVTALGQMPPVHGLPSTPDGSVWHRVWWD